MEELRSKLATLEDLAFNYIVNVVNTKVAELMEKRNGRFCPKTGTPCYVVVPKYKEWLLGLKNRYGFSLRDYCRCTWPAADITNPSDIDIVFQNGEWKKEHLGDDTWAIIDRKGYGDPSAGEDSFVMFKI